MQMLPFYKAGTFDVSATGEITTNAVLDRETTAQYTLVVQVSDDGAQPLSTSVTVIVTVTGTFQRHLLPTVI